MNTTALKDQPRLLLKATLEPQLGHVFQPTGFPDLGAATFKAIGKDGASRCMLLVESHQSMGNRFEKVCWDEAKGKLVAELDGLPYVESTLPDGTKTNTILEAHRLNSPYIVNSAEFEEIEKAIGFEKNKPFDRRKLAEALLKYDPSSLLHGIFLEKVGGVVRLPRALTGFIEAEDVNPVAFGGVKLDRIQPESTGDKTPYGKAKDGYGNVPHHIEDFTGTIYAYFNLDLALLRGLGLPDDSADLLVCLALFKIRKFLSEGLNLRSRCQLQLVSLETLGSLKGIFELPDLETIVPELKRRIQAAGPLFSKSPLPVRYDQKLAAKRSKTKDKSKDGAGEADAEGDDTSATESHDRS
jgi:CRISPR-associated protein Csb1